MKKYLGISIIILVVACVLCGVGIMVDSRQYFKEYFEAKRQKLNLMDEASVDSLQQVITIKTIMIDSLRANLQAKETQCIEYKKQNDAKDKSIKNLNNVIAHQNKIIDGLRQNTSN